MSDERPKPAQGKPTERTTPESVEAELQTAAGSDDEERLKVLEELYAALENELEGDLDQEGSTGP